MKTSSLLLAIALVALLGCQAPAAPSAAPTSTPAATPATGIEGIVADLDSGGADAKLGSPFLSDPIGGQGTTVCVGPETVQVYQFIDHEAALAASVKIDRNDPSHIGNGIVDWIGQPRFWLRDRLIVLYLGDDATTDAALRGALGQPFAESRVPAGGFLPTPPCQ